MISNAIATAQTFFTAPSIGSFLRGITLLASLSITALAQNPDPAARPDRGTRPVGSYSISDLENISLTSGNLNLSIPLAGMPPISGGKVSFGLRAYYNSKNWDTSSIEHAATDPFYHPGFWTSQELENSDVGGWRIGGRYRIHQHLADDDFQPADPGCTGGLACLEKEYKYKLILITPDGAEHELRPMDSQPGASQNYRIGFYRDTPATTGLSMRYYSFDGSYLYAVIQPYNIAGDPGQWSVYLPDGTLVFNNGNNQRITDTNGNNIKINTVTDTSTGITTTRYRDEQAVMPDFTTREIVQTDYPDNTTTIRYQIVGGGTVDVNIAWGTVHVEQLYNIADHVCPDVLALLFTDVRVMRSITLPESEPGQPLASKQFTFKYNCETYDSHPGQDVVNVSWRSDCTAPTVTQASVSHGWASLSRMDMPSGARVEYNYTLDGNSSAPRLFKGARHTARESISQKLVTHDGSSDSWSHNIGTTSGSVTGPDGSVTTEMFYPHDPADVHLIGGSDGRGGLVYRTKRSDINLSDKEIIERRWTLKVFNGGDATAPNGLANFNPVVEAEYITVLGPSGSKMSAKKYRYDYNGNLVQETDYDWVDLSLVTDRDPDGVPNSFPGTSVLRTVNNSYYNPGPVDSDPGSTNVYAKRDKTAVAPLILNAPRDTITGASQTRFSYDLQQFDNPPTVGNLTKVSRFKGGTTWIDTTYTYDAYGNKLSVTDPNANKTDFTYDTSTHAQPTEISVYPDRLNPNIKHTTTIAYDYWTGLVASQTDPNGNATATIYDNQLMSTPTNPVKDPFGRPGKVINPLGRKVVMLYHDSARQLETKADLKTVDDALLKTITSRDQLGRATQVDSSEDGVSYTISARTIYQQMGKITFASNPSRATATDTDGWTRTTRDELGRIVEVATFGGSSQPPTTGCSSSNNCTGNVTTSYDSIFTTVADQASKQRRSVVDGLGRLVRVDEPTASGLGMVGSPNQKTDYSYDSLGNLTLVTQGTQTRTFEYDNLSRLTKAFNPEQVNSSGTQVATQYDYDDASNLTTKTNPNGTTVGFSYDGLNQVKTKTLSTGGVWDYTYDTATISNAKGRLVSVVLHSGADGYYYDGYDALGRVTANRQVTSAGSANTYTMSYEYDVAGNMTRQVYPSGKAVITEYDNAGRIAGVKKEGAGYYAGAIPTDATNRIQYGAHGRMTALKFGNQKWEHTLFNSRLQPREIGLGTSSIDSSLLKLEYKYGVIVNNQLDTSQNNGNVQSEIITAPGLLLTQSYSYDELNRLSNAIESGGANEWSQTCSYDRFGNRAAVGGTVLDSARTPQSLVAFDTLTNRIKPSVMTGFGYDTSGNLTSDPSAGIAYDAENHQTGYGTSIYSYDGDGRRVKKQVGSTTTIFVYNVLGQLIAEYDNSTSPAAGSGTSYLISDHLGSTRAVMKSDGSVARHDYLPFGEDIPSSIGGRAGVAGYSTADSTRQKFTQKERDIESGLDYFLARYYSSAQGRFTSPDEFAGGAHEFWILGSGDTEKQALPYADITNPQSLNKYHYAFNNPLRYVDPDGHQEGAALRQDRDVKDYLEGRISKQEYMERQAARAAGAIVGAAIVATPQIVQSILLWSAANPDKVQQIAAALQETAGGPPGAISGAVGSASKAELSIAQKLATEGKNVEVLAATGVGRTADFLVNGIKTELKTLEGVGGAATSGTVKNAIGRALGQSGDVIVDAGKVNLSLAEAQKGAARAFGADKRLQTVRIIGKDFDFTVARQH